jgi:hypothetical protein
VVRYRWQVERRPELSGTRPAAVDWYRLRPPGWFLGEGWSLTPEVGGLTEATGTGPDRQPIRGYVRRLSGPMHAVVGGRYLGSEADPPVSMEMRLDGSAIDRWTVTSTEPAFVRFVELPAGVPGRAGDYATLAIHAQPSQPSGASPRPVAIRRFDIQPVLNPVFGFGAGWHEEEYDGATGLRWRWTSDRAVLRVRGVQRAIRVRLRGESPLRYFEAAPTLRLSAGGRVIETLQPSADWVWNVVVPPDVLAEGGGDLVLDTNRVFVPAEIEGSPDTRRLGLRVFAVDVESAR